MSLMTCAYSASFCTPSTCIYVRQAPYFPQNLSEIIASIKNRMAGREFVNGQPSFQVCYQVLSLHLYSCWDIRDIIKFSTSLTSDNVLYRITVLPSSTTSHGHRTAAQMARLFDWPVGRFIFLFAGRPPEVRDQTSSLVAKSGLPASFVPPWYVTKERSMLHFEHGTEIIFRSKNMKQSWNFLPHSWIISRWCVRGVVLCKRFFSQRTWFVHCIILPWIAAVTQFCPLNVERKHYSAFMSFSGATWAMYNLQKSCTQEWHTSSCVQVWCGNYHSICRRRILTVSRYAK